MFSFLKLCRVYKKQMGQKKRIEVKKQNEKLKETRNNSKGMIRNFKITILLKCHWKRQCKSTALNFWAGENFLSRFFCAN